MKTVYYLYLLAIYFIQCSAMLYISKFSFKLYILHLLCFICFLLVSKEKHSLRHVLFLVIFLSFHSRCQRVSLCCDCPVTGRRFCFTVTFQTSCWRRGSRPWRSFTALPLTGWRSVPPAWLIWCVWTEMWRPYLFAGCDGQIAWGDCAT